MDDELATYLDDVLDGPQVVCDHSWAHGKSLVLEVADADGTRWFVKQHRGADWYRAERAAYRRWVPALSDRAPTLHASDDDLQVLILSAIPGRAAPDTSDPDVHRDAGALLRRFHDAEDLGPWADVAEAKLADLERWAHRGAGLFTARELDFVRADLRALEAARPARVPCHLDYTPRNWLVSDGRVAVVDFEESAPDMWVTDIGRLYFGWWRDPLEPGRAPPYAGELEDAFLEGYGRRLADDDLFQLRAGHALTTVRLVVLARELGQAHLEPVMRAVLEGLMRGR